MRPQNDLHSLIKSMTKAEKRHFKLSATLNSRNGSSNYLQLFDAIEKQSAYNEEKLRKKFANQAFGKRFPTTKYLLTELILKELRLFNNGRTPQKELENKLEEIELLYQRGLYRQGNKILDKAKQKATQLEMLPILKKILSWEKRFLVHLAPKKLNEAFCRLNRETIQLNKQLGTCTWYQEVLDKATFLYRTCQNPDLVTDAKDMEDCLQHQLMTDVALAPTFEAKITFHEIYAVYNLTFGTMETCFEHFANIQELWSQHPEKVETLKEIYLRTGIAFLKTGIHSMQLQGLKEMIQNLKTVLEDDRLRFRKQYFEILMLEFNYELYSGNLENCRSLFDDIRNQLNADQEVLDQFQIINVYFHLGVYCFITKEYNESLDWLNKTLDFENSGLYPEVMAIAKLMRIPAQFELKHYFLLEYELRNTKRYLVKKQRYGRLEKQIFKQVRKCLSVSTEKEVTAALEELKEMSACVKQPSEQPVPFDKSVIISYWLMGRSDAA